MKNQKTQPDKCQVELKLKDGTSLKAEGDSIYKALCNLKPLDPLMVKSTGVLTVNTPKGKTERYLNVPKVKALFNDKIKVYKQVFAKNLELFIK